MLIIDNKTKTIFFNRGDEIDIILNGFVSEDGDKYKFKNGDKVTLKIYNKKKYTQEEVFKKVFTVEQETENIEINLTKKDTEFCIIANKPLTFEYEIILNDKYTMLGYDSNGSKSLIVNPSEKGGE